MAPAGLIAPAPGSGSGAPVDRTAEAIVGGAPFGMMGLEANLRALGRRRDVAHRRLGDLAYDLIDLDPVAGGSLDLLVSACLSNKMALTARVRPREGRAADDRAAADLSAEARDLCEYGLERLDTPLHETSARLIRSALKHGASLGEVVWTRVERGRFAGKWVPRSLKDKARRDWDFAVDPYLNVGGYFGRSADGGWRVWPREKFLGLTFGGEGCDPRGWSAYDRAAEAWNFRSQVPAEHFKFLQRFGQPTPAVVLPEDPQGALDPATGRVLSAAEGAQAALEQYMSGRYIILPHGATLSLNEPRAEGNAFKMALDQYAREIARAILLQVRATMEAESGSKADSETAERLLGNLVLFVRRWWTRAVEWSLLYLTVLYNYGPDVADAHTPTADLGAVSEQETAALWTAFAAMKGELVPEQLPEMYARLNLAPATLDEVQAHFASRAVPPPMPPPPAPPAPAPPGGEEEE